MVTSCLAEQRLPGLGFWLADTDPSVVRTGMRPAKLITADLIEMLYRP
ncbi:hypothetical protein [Streptomyces bobili]